MQKASLFLALLLTILYVGCGVDTTNPQASRSIEESKKNNIFVREAHADQRPDSLIVEEAWIEKSWYNDYVGNKLIKTITNGCQLVFKIKQVAGCKFLLDNYFHWAMLEEWSGSSVGVQLYRGFFTSSGVYVFHLKNCELPTHLTFNLFTKDSNRTKTKVGILTFNIGDKYQMWK